MEKSRMENRTFKETEKLLYAYEALKEHIKDEEEYIDMIYKKTSGSVIKYSNNKTIANEKERLKERKESYEISKLQFERLEKALNKIKNHFGYEIIEYRYLKRKNKKGDIYSYEEIANILAGQREYNENLSEKTIRKYKNVLVREMAILLFGADAI